MSSGSKQSGRLSLAFRDLEDIHPRIVEQFAHRVVDLDLSNNKLSNIDSLKAFTKLETLVLDNNCISSHTKFPPLPALTTLWVNRNKITNLSTFIDKLVVSLPNLKYLSMLGNEACPNFLNGGSLSQYNDYRKYIISRMRNLTQLDSDSVTAEERATAIKIYGNLPTTVAKEEDESAAKRQQEKEEKIRLEQEEAKKRQEERRRKRQELAKQKSEIQQSNEGAGANQAKGVIPQAPPPPSKAVSQPVLKTPSKEIKAEEIKQETKKEVKSKLSQPILDILPEVEDLPVVVEHFDEAPPPVSEIVDVDCLTSDDDWSDDSGDDSLIKLM